MSLRWCSECEKERGARKKRGIQEENSEGMVLNSSQVLSAHTHTLTIKKDLCQTTFSDCNTENSFLFIELKMVAAKKVWISRRRKTTRSHFDKTYILNEIPLPYLLSRVHSRPSYSLFHSHTHPVMCVKWSTVAAAETTTNNINTRIHFA